MRGSSRIGRKCAALVGATALAWALLAAPATAQSEEQLRGRVLTSAVPLPGYEISLFATSADGPALLGRATSGPAGDFAIGYAPQPASSVIYAVAEKPGSPVVLSGVLGVGDSPTDVILDEKTTVAAAYALAQFTEDGGVAGPAPGLHNAARMAHNLVDPVTGDIAPVLGTPPNGPETEALATFGSLADMVANCIALQQVCDQLVRLAGTSGGAPASDTWQALVNTARHPWQNVVELFAVSKTGPSPIVPDRILPPSAWTLALRFVGDGVSMDGPGNMTVDRDGNIWVTNNYEYAPGTDTPVCGADNLIRLTPTGEFYPGSPYTGGGLSGAGFGIDIDRDGNVWVANFGFAAPAPGCPDDRQPPHNSLSVFTADGQPISPDTGFTQGGIDWPQGLISHSSGDIWTANCGNDSVTIYPGGNPAAGRNLTDLGVTKPFALAEGADGRVFVTGNGSDTVAVLDASGTPIVPAIGGAGLEKPLGVAVDSAGTAWVANSRVIGIPCPDPALTPTLEGSLTMIDGNLTPFPITGGGLRVPWGVVVDGNDNIWVANFAGRAVSQFCGSRAVACRPGTTTGAPISPDVTGYGFDGLVRNTGITIDQAGNVWVANNWKEIPIQTNPGGYEMVAFVGAAAPVTP
ncbi:NHL repeat-containing protein [Rhodococcus rhodochrous]|uniref:NHL repeat-containing protein n=1 Tax=Rhodococcus rhodochrous TaxID=1829 RepID=UPI000C1FC8EC|nr:NHL repeat-containing protein [Rhodococcus rhodochrous]